MQRAHVHSALITTRTALDPAQPQDICDSQKQYVQRCACASAGVIPVPAPAVLQPTDSCSWHALTALWWRLLVLQFLLPVLLPALLP